MGVGASFNLSSLGRRVRAAVQGPQALVFLPALTLGSYWLGGEPLLITSALLFPAALAGAGMISGTGPAWTDPRDRESGLPLAGTAVRALRQAVRTAESAGLGTAALVVRLDDAAGIARRFGEPAAARIIGECGQRLRAAVRENDTLARLDGSCFGVVLEPTRRVDLEAMLNISARLQATLEEPFVVDGARMHLTASVGFCVAERAPNREPQTILDCARSAADAAAAAGAGSIRAYSSAIARDAATQETLAGELARAVEDGQIRPWFQPQLSTDTGRVIGFEALLRWEHPQRGIVLPGEFLPLASRQGLMPRLGEIAIHHALKSLCEWRAAGHEVAAVSINLSCDELADPKLADRIAWELERFGLAPADICLDIAESVVDDADDEVVTRSIGRLAAMGCKIALDSFGAGKAGLSAIRRFNAGRINIDRSFIARLDKEASQHEMVAGILSLAERLNVETLAANVETVAEHAALAQMGCDAVQGFSIARPMPPEDCREWLAGHATRLARAAELGKRAIS